MRNETMRERNYQDKDYTERDYQDRRRARIAAKKRRAQQKRMKAFFSVMAMLFVVLLGTSMFSLKTRANSLEGANDYKYYANYCIEPGDSIWSIAADHIDYVHYDSIHQYAKEIQTINKINTDHITNGTYIMLPYYDDELK